MSKQPENLVKEGLYLRLNRQMAELRHGSTGTLHQTVARQESLDTTVPKKVTYMKVFISYSHNDEVALERLHIHLTGLRREGRIHEWFDREILAGGNIDDEINERVESSRLFLLLISPDFIASDYCMERE